MHQYVFQPLVHLQPVHLASIVDLDPGPPGTPTLTSNFTKHPSLLCPITIESDATSWGSTDRMQWQHHIVHIGKGNVKQELVAKNNWA